MIREDWSVDVKHNESQKFTLGNWTYLYITQVSLVQEVKNGGKGVVGDFSVWCNTSNGENRVEMILATVSSEHASEEIAELVLSPRMTIDLSHGWNWKEGTVQIRGFTEKYPGCPEESATSFLTPTEEEDEDKDEEEHVNFADCIPVFEEGSSKWSVVVNSNESLPFTVEDDKFIRITRVALVKNGGEGVVEEFDVYCNKINYYGEKKLLAILSSEHAEEVVTGFGLQPAEVVEFSLGPRDGGIVHIHGEMNTCSKIAG